MPQTVTIRQLRTDFRSVKRKLEAHGEIIITDHGTPAYVLKSLPRPASPKTAMPDYYSRLVARQPVPMTEAESKRLWEEERGER